MALLADGINLPLVAAFGLVTYAPLTLLVTAIECGAFRWLFRTSMRRVFPTLLIANIWSTLAGLAVLMAQDWIVDRAGISSSIPAFVRGYRWAALILIALYWSKSVLVEFPVALGRKLQAVVGCSRGRLLGGITVANVLSYLVVGPLFYLTTRPHFGGWETTAGTAWTQNADELVYFIDPATHVIKRVQADGSHETTVVPHPATAFLVGGDPETIVYCGTDQNLYVWQTVTPTPILVENNMGEHFMIDSSLCPEGRRLAYLGSSPKGTWDRPQRPLRILDLSSGERVEVPEVRLDGPIAWSADGRRIFARKDRTTIAAIRGEPPYDVCENVRGSPPAPESLVVNYLRGSGDRQWSSDGTEVYWSEDRAGEWTASVYPYLGSHLRISRDGSRHQIVQNAYGLLNLGLPSWEYPAFLPRGAEFVVEGWYDQLYVIDADDRRIGLLCAGIHYVLKTPRFRMRFDPGS
jgi:hypothetical protein